MSRSNTRRHRFDEFDEFDEDDTRFGGDRGWVMAMAGMMVIPLMAAIACAVDVGSWYAQATREQRAADAASLAGVVYLPDVVRAKKTACDTLVKNGVSCDYTTMDSMVTVIPPNQVKVNVTQGANVYFARAVGLSNQSIGRSATAEFLNTIKMGSPNPYSGNDPDRGLFPNFWHNTSGYGNNKETGDRYSGSTCNTGNYGCSSGSNSERSELGYFFDIHVPDSPPPQLQIQVFDPAGVDNGDTCSYGMPNRATDTQATDKQGQFATLKTVYDTAFGAGDSNRYDANYAQSSSGGANSGFCTGDWVGGSGGGAATDTKVDETYIVREPGAGGSTDPTALAPVCAMTFSAYPVNGSVMKPTTASGSVYYPLIDTSTGVPKINNTNRGYENVPFYQHYHRWFSVCTINNPKPGDYVLQVRNNLKPSSGYPAGGVRTATGSTLNLTAMGLNSEDTTLNTQIHNRYSIRSFFGSTCTTGSCNTPTGLSVAADSRLPMFVNQQSAAVGGSTNFFLARITPEYKGKTVQMQLFDIGDAGNPESLTIVPPPGNNISCSWKLNDGAMPSGLSVSACTVSNITTTTNQGKLLTSDIVIPSDYTCVATDPNSCWFKIQIQGGAFTDTTTWSAIILGNPVHLLT